MASTASRVVLEITMSLDGIVAGPGIRKDQPMGKNGERLHDWMFAGKTTDDTALLKEVMASMGAVIIGNHIYKTAIDEAWAGTSPFNAPTFVLCHRVPEKTVPGFTFVTDGIGQALEKAKAAAGEKNIWIMGGANMAQQYLRAGLVDELHIHIASMLLGEGTRLFDDLIGFVELKKIKTIDTPAAIHVRYEVVKR